MQSYENQEGQNAKRWISVSEYAARQGAHLSTVYRMAKRGEIASRQSGDGTQVQCPWCHRESFQLPQRSGSYYFLCTQQVTWRPLRGYVPPYTKVRVRKMGQRYQVETQPATWR